MRYQGALGSYGSVQVTTGVATASNVELIMMLFDGLIETLSVVRGHIEHKAIIPKSQAINKASKIVLGLQSALDLEKGGDLARNLFDLYTYVVRKLVEVNANNDVALLEDLRSMILEIRQAWQDVPALLPATQPGLTRHN